MRRLLFALCLAGTLPFLLFLGREDITSSFEGRVAATAKAMVQSGDWIVPRLGGEIRLEKPPLPYWAAAALWRLSGGFEPWLARLPAALCGVAVFWMLLDLALRRYGLRAAMACAVLWPSTFFVVGEFRKAMADPYLAAASFAAVWAWLRTQEDPGACGRRAARTASALLFWAALGFGILAKGPVVFVHAALALCAYHITRGARPRLGAEHIFGGLLFAAIALPWPLLVLQKVPGALEIWGAQSLGQIVSHEKVRPIWYYLPQLPYIALPWTLLVLPWAEALPAAPSPAARRERLWPVVWLLSTVAFFSISNMKKNAYLLPAMPAIILAIAFGWARITKPRPATRRTAGGLFFALHAGAALTATGALFAATAVLYCAGGDAVTPEVVSGLVVLAGLAAVLGGAMCRRRLPWTSRWIAMGLLCVIAAHLWTGWIEPRRRNAESRAPFAREVNRLVNDAPFYAYGPVHEGLLFYLERVPRRIESLPENPGALDGYLLLRVKALPPALLGREAATATAPPEGRPRYRLVRLGRR